VIAIELLCAAQALDLFTNMQPGVGTQAAYGVIRKAVPHLENDRILSEDIRRIVELVRSGAILEAVESAVGAVR
jgi:histidine ammonia-lyase